MKDALKEILFVRLSPNMCIPHPHPQDAAYAFDVAQAAAFLNRELFEVKFVDGVVENLGVDDIVDRIITFTPDILALTTTSSAEQYAMTIFKRAKELLPDLYIIAFGQHAHYCPDTFLNQSFQIDACVYGEPEETLVELIKNVPGTPDKKKLTKGIHFWNNRLVKTAERELTIDIDQWPMPRYEIFKNHDYRIISANFPVFRNIKAGWVLASRGCPYQCTICSPAIRRSFGTSLRKFSPQRVADTFEFLEYELKVNTIYIGDDTFSLDMEWAEQVCDELIRRKNKVQWLMSTRADRLSSMLIEKMKASGMRSAAIGVEAGSERVLNDINKKITLEQIEWAVAEFEKNGISVNVSAIVGHVDETMEELNETFSFLKKLNPIFVQLHYLSPYPGTKVADVFKKKFKNTKYISHYNTEPMNVSKIPEDILFGSIKRYYISYYMSWRFVKKYISQRMPYTLTNPIKEFKLIKDSLAYFLIKDKTEATSKS